MGIRDEIIVSLGLISHKMVFMLKVSVFSVPIKVNVFSVPIRQVDSIYRTRAKKH